MPGISWGVHSTSRWAQLPQKFTFWGPSYCVLVRHLWTTCCMASLDQESPMRCTLRQWLCHTCWCPMDMSMHSIQYFSLLYRHRSAQRCSLRTKPCSKVAETVTGVISRSSHCKSCQTTPKYSMRNTSLFQTMTHLETSGSERTQPKMVCWWSVFCVLLQKQSIQEPGKVVWR